MNGRRTLLALALLVILVARLFWIAIAAPASGIDFSQFWTVARAARALGVSNPYSPEARAQLSVVSHRMAEAQAPRSARLDRAVRDRTSVDTFSTPFLYLAFVPVASASYDESLDRFRLFSLLCLLFGAALLCRVAGFDWALTSVALLLLIWFSDAVIADAQVANVNSLQLAALALYVWLARGVGARRQTAAGAVLGLLVAFKPTLGLVAVFLALGWLFSGRRERLIRQGLGVTGAAVFAVLASSVWLGSARVWLDWLQALPDLERVSDVRVNMGNFALARVLSEAGAPDVSLLALGAVTLGFAAAAWQGRRESLAEPDADFLVVGLGCAVSLVGLRLAWVHYYVLVAPLAICLLGRVTARALALVVGAAALLALGGPLRTFAPWVDMQAQASGLLAGTSVLALVGLVKLAGLRVRIGV